MAVSYRIIATFYHFRASKSTIKAKVLQRSLFGIFRRRTSEFMLEVGFPTLDVGGLGGDILLCMPEARRVASFRQEKAEQPPSMEERREVLFERIDEGVTEGEIKRSG